MLKTVSSVANAIGALNYKGTWNASTNTPTLASGVGTKGDYYQVSVAGTTSLDGISNWGVGDVVAFNGTTWQRIEGGADLNGVNLSYTGTLTGGTGVIDIGSNQIYKDASGNVSIGMNTTVVGSKFNIAGNLGMTGNQTNYDNASGTIEFVNRNSGGAKTFQWYFSASGGGTPATLSTAGVWTNASDARGKENIQDIHYGIETVLALVPRQYDVKSDNSHAIGFVAQEVLPIIPELVHGSEENGYGLDYGTLTAVLVKAIQQLNTEIVSLKAELQSLKG